METTRFGERVICNGFPGKVIEVYGGDLVGMACVAVPGGSVAVSIRELRPRSGDCTCPDYLPAATGLCPSCAAGEVAP